MTRDDAINHLYAVQRRKEALDALQEGAAKCVQAFRHSKVDLLLFIDVHERAAVIQQGVDHDYAEARSALMALSDTAPSART